VTGKVRPLRALVANAGPMSSDTRLASAGGYEVTSAVDYLAHARIIGDLLDVFNAPARIVLPGSNTYYANLGRYRATPGRPAPLSTVDTR